MKIDLLTAIQFVVGGWRSVTIQTIRNCFAKCGFQSQLPLSIPSIVPSERKQNSCRVRMPKNFFKLTAAYSATWKMTERSLKKRCEQVSRDTEPEENRAEGIAIEEHIDV